MINHSKKFMMDMPLCVTTRVRKDGRKPWMGMQMMVRINVRPKEL